MMMTLERGRKFYRDSMDRLAEIRLLSCEALRRKSGKKKKRMTEGIVLVHANLTRTGRSE
jgi:hypothetical protein